MSAGLRMSNTWEGNDEHTNIKFYSMTLAGIDTPVTVQQANSKTFGEFPISSEVCSTSKIISSNSGNEDLFVTPLKLNSKEHCLIRTDEVVGSPSNSAYDDPFSSTFDEILDSEEKSLVSSPGFLNSAPSIDILIYDEFLAGGLTSDTMPSAEILACVVPEEVNSCSLELVSEGDESLDSAPFKESDKTIVLHQDPTNKDQKFSVGDPALLSDSSTRPHSKLNDINKTEPVISEHIEGIAINTRSIHQNGSRQMYIEHSKSSDDEHIAIKAMTQSIKNCEGKVAREHDTDEVLAICSPVIFCEDLSSSTENEEHVVIKEMTHILRSNANSDFGESLCMPYKSDGRESMDFTQMQIASKRVLGDAETKDYDSAHQAFSFEKYHTVTSLPITADKTTLIMQHHHHEEPISVKLAPKRDYVEEDLVLKNLEKDSSEYLYRSGERSSEFPNENVCNNRAIGENKTEIKEAECPGTRIPHQQQRDVRESSQNPSTGTTGCQLGSAENNKTHEAYHSNNIADKANVHTSFDMKTFDKKTDQADKLSIVEENGVTLKTEEWGLPVEEIENIKFEVAPISKSGSHGAARIDVNIEVDCNKADPSPDRETSNISTDKWDQSKQHEVSSDGTCRNNNGIENDQVSEIVCVSQLNKSILTDDSVVDDDKQENADDSPRQLYIEEEVELNITESVAPVPRQPIKQMESTSLVEKASRENQENDHVIKEGWKPIKHKLAIFEKSLPPEDNVTGKIECKSEKGMLKPKRRDIKWPPPSIDRADQDESNSQREYQVLHAPNFKQVSHLAKPQVEVATMVTIPSHAYDGDPHSLSPPPLPPMLLTYRENRGSTGPTITSITCKSMEATAGTKPTFEQRREKELDDILHALQATVQKMEQDCFPGHSTTWQAYSQSAKLMDGRGHCFSLSSDGSLGNSNFVAPPLPPPPTEEDLASFSGESSSSQKTSSPTPLQTVVSPTYKASSNFSVWSPGGGKNTSEPQGTYGGSKSSSTAPAGFRKVSRPISKDFPSSPFLFNYSANCGMNTVTPLSNFSSGFANVPAMPVDAENHKAQANNTPKPANGTETCAKDFQLLYPSKSVSKSFTGSNCANEGGWTKQHLVTLLRDTRRILIKSDKSPSSSSVTTSYHFPGNVLPEPSESVKVTPKNGLPDGAVYETKTVDGDMVHTDTYYPAPGDSTVLERTKKTTVIKAEHHHGMGPTDDHGVPTALRSTVDNPKAWYKNMFKQIHKVDQEGTDDQNHYSSDGATEEPMKSQVPLYKPKRLGKITDYTPSDPYVVESKPKKSIADYSSWRSKETQDRINSKNTKSADSNGYKPVKNVQRSSSLEDFIQKEWDKYFDDLGQPVPKHAWFLERQESDNRIPKASTSYNPTRDQFKKPEVKSSEEPVHGTEYAVKDYPMADHVVIEPKHVVTMNLGKQKDVKKPEESKRIPARAKFDFHPQSNKQLGLKKKQIVIITKEVNKDWYEGETTDGKSHGMFPVAYVEVLSQTERKSQRKGVAKAKFDFNGTNAKQLSVKKGETIELIEKVDGNWYKASIGQRAGLVPANYLEIVSQPTAPQTESGAKSETKSAVSPTAKSPPAHTANRTVSSSLSNDEPDDEEKMSRASFLAHAVVNSGAQLSKPRVSQGEFDIPELSDEALGFTKRTNGNRDSHASVDTSSSSAASDLHSDLAQNLKIKDQETSESSKLPENDPQKHLEPHEIINDDFPVQREKFVAVYQYLPQNEDELELLHGDIVLVVEKCDDGWYVGTCERTGAFGTFPGNYVTPA